MEKRLYGIRGAVCTEDNEKEIIHNVSTLYTTIIKNNKLDENDIVSIQFTITPDIKELNPAAALRKAGFASSIPLFCSLEPVFKNSLTKVIRCLITAYSDRMGESVYLNGAEVLRPDLCRSKTEN